MDELKRLKPGMKVSDVSYRSLGEVEAVSGSSFELDLADDGTVTLGEEGSSMLEMPARRSSATPPR